MPNALVFPPPTKRQRIGHGFTLGVTLSIAAILLGMANSSLLELGDIESGSVWDALLGKGIVLLFAGFFVSVAWSSRLGALPFRFVADSSNRQCGYLWKSWWTHKVDLSNAMNLKGDVYYGSTSPYTGSWRWSISVSRKKFDKKKQIYSPLDGFRTEEEAVLDCRRTLDILSAHLRLPAEFTFKPDESNYEQAFDPNRSSASLSNSESSVRGSDG